MKVADAVAVAGHEVHVCRYREARTLLRRLAPEHGDLRGLRLVAASDRNARGDGRAIVLVRARRQGRREAAHSAVRSQPGGNT